MEKNAASVYHLTFPKCGSQWIRDVLTAPEVAEHVDVRWLGEGGNLMKRGWPTASPGNFIGPVYHASREDWEHYRQPGDRAVAVIRDPRDRLISWVFSMTYSHVSNGGTDLIRGPLQKLGIRDSLRIGMDEFSRCFRAYLSWAGGSSDGVYVTSYEEIVKNELIEFQKIIGFLEWDVPQASLESATDRLSFSKRSGRERGDENIYSHYRKGKPGDWRRFFDRETGQLWEKHFGGVLTKLGYESDEDWYLGLPEQLNDLPQIDTSESLHEIRAENARLREQNAELQRGIAATRMALDAERNQ